jgi:hypothetical protein
VCPPRGMVILIPNGSSSVDDEDGMRGFLFTILARAGCEVVAADSVQAGRAVLDEEMQPELLIDCRLGWPVIVRFAIFDSGISD